MLNSSSEIQWTVMVSWEAVQSSSRIDGGFGAERRSEDSGKESVSEVVGVFFFLVGFFFPSHGD